MVERLRGNGERIYEPFFTAQVNMTPEQEWHLSYLETCSDTHERETGRYACKGCKHLRVC